MVALVLDKVMVMPKTLGDAKFKSERGRAAGLRLTSHLHALLPEVFIRDQSRSIFDS